MIFILCLGIVQCRKALGDPVPTPEVYPLSISTRVMKMSGDYSCVSNNPNNPTDPDCPITDFDSPSTYRCGQVCWSDNGNAEFTYTFKGVQFLIYGNKTSKTGSFDLLFDNKHIATINEKLNEGENEENFTLLYTSQVYTYGEHKITARGIKGDTFSIFKFAFWPHLKSRRLNISEMKSTGKWKQESDEIGGIREFSQAKDSSKSLTIEASKLWVYGTPDPEHGKMRISFNTLDEIVDTRQPREDCKLLFESGDIPSTFHQLDLVAIESRPILIYVVYYLYDPPQQTPMAHPSRSPHPQANPSYIDKLFENVNVPQIKDTNTKQISGCTFKNIVKDTAVYFIRVDQSEILFYNNRFEFTTASTDNPGILFLSQTLSGKFTISQCTFINCVSSDGDGNAVNCRANIELTIEGSRFVNCFVPNAKKPPGVVRFSQEDSDQGSLKITDCTFQFSIDTQSCPALYGRCPSAIIKGCTFSKCCAANLTNKVNSFTFSDNIITYSAHQGIIIGQLEGTANISGNTFKYNKVTDSCYLLLTGTKDTSNLYITKNTFENCKAKDFVIQVSHKKPEIENNQFVFDVNDANSACGAINSVGSGFSCKFCTFTRTFSKGAITVTQTAQQTDPVTVSNCVFDNCGGTNTRCFSLTTFTGSLTFSNNIVQNMQAGGANSYFGQFLVNNKIETLVLKNVTFKDNSCNSQYGGGTGLWIDDVKEVSFEDCKFINNVATSSNRGHVPTGMQSYTSGDGGALQYGFSPSIYEINMKFDNCLFSRNKAVRHGGALALQTVGTVVINKCIFEENIANYKQSSAELLENHFNKKSEGRGGAIYINPVFELQNHDHKTKYMKSVTITGCTFKSNSAFDGFAIYIEGDDPGTTFTIKDNTFTSNSDGTSNSENRAIVLSEIDSLCKSGLDSSNTFTNPVGISIYKLLCVDHNARTPSQTPMPTVHNATFGDQCDPRCEVKEEAPQYPSFYEIKDVNLENKNDNGKDGGAAVHLKNVGVSIAKSTFKECKSEENGGGAIYIVNEVEFQNVINIENTRFEGCQSCYGGAVFIRSIYDACPVSISNCHFENNRATRTQSSDNLFGGSAVFLNVRKGHVVDCNFIKNKGKGGGIKVFNDFNMNLKSTLLTSFFNRNSVVISDCLFEIDDEQHSSSIFYHGGKFGSQLSLRNCEFKGKVAKNGHHIDGMRLDRESPKISVKNCRFETDVKSSLNIKGNFISVNLNEQVFNSQSAKKDDSKSGLMSYAILAMAALLALVVLISFIVFGLKKSNQNNEEEEEKEEQNNDL